MKENETFLIQQVQKGQSHAFEPLVQKYRAMVFGVALKVMESKDEAEDVAQEVFIKVYRVIGQFKGESKFSTWLYKVAYFHALDSKKKKYRRYRREQESDLRLEESYEESHEMDGNYRNELLKDAISKLSTEEQILIDLYYYEESPIKEIAEILQWSESNVKVRLHRIRKRLFTLLENKKSQMY
ncbi:MAG: RNA polymerase sigma factor [Flavobacteriaceae bacterium]|nr:RNA polymerase sigma factor [Flavobacteriaceae bacterium]